MKTLPLSVALWLLQTACWAQSNLNYNAGYYSGVGGSYNVFVGPFTGFATTTGQYNNFVGYRAGLSNTTGYHNSFLGPQAGYFNRGGHDNSFVGTNAGYANTTGTNNSFIGSFAGVNNTTGSNNSFMGYQADYNNTGERNTFLGTLAGFANTSGVANCYVGAYAGQNNTGFSNSLLGAYAGYSSTSATNNSFVGRDAGYATTTGGYNSILGYAAGYKNTTGNYNRYMGAYANASATGLSYAGAIGYRAYVTASNSLVLGSINGQNGATVSTKVGIGTTAPGYLLHVNGTAAKPGGGSWTVASDERLKKDVSEFKDGLDVLEKIKPVWFRYNGKAGLPTNQKYVGVLAQQMQQIAPYTVGEFTYQDSTGKAEKYLDYDANAVTYLLVNAVKEVDQKYAQQLKEKDQLLTAQQQQLANLTDRLAQLEALVGQLAGGEPIPTGAAAQLFQNEPNPTEGSTVIRYFLPRQITSAQLKVYSLTGVEVQAVALTQKGQGQVTLSVSQLAAGEYVYHLLVDGQSIAFKKLLLQK